MSSPITGRRRCPRRRQGTVDNDATIRGSASKMAVLHADAGSHMVGPSGMMDGQVGVDP